MTVPEGMPIGPSASRTDIYQFLAFARQVLRESAHLDARWERSVPVTFEQAEQSIKVQAERYADPFRLSVVGEFKAGKSSMINALIGRPGLVPQAIVPTTGAVTEIWGASPERGEVIARDGRVIFSGSVQDAAVYADQRSDMGRKYSGAGVRVKLTIDSPLLHNLIIVDTPGLGANDHDDEVTIESLKLTDAAVLVVNGLRPGGEEAERLAERLRIEKRRMIAVVTRMDQVGEREDAIEGTRAAFPDVIEGDPIGFDTPGVLAAQQELEAARAAGDESRTAQAERDLEAAGLVELRDRLRESLVTGPAVGQRLDRVVTTVTSDLGRLSQDAAGMAGLREGQARALETEVTEIAGQIDKILRPRREYIDAKIGEIVDLHVGAYMAQMAEAVDVYIDRVADAGVLGSAKVLWNMRDKEVEEEYRQDLVDKFKTIFPDELAEVAVDRISREIHHVLEGEWREALRDVRAAGGGGSFDPGDLVDQITDHLRRLAVSLAVDGALLIMLFNPGGMLFELALLALSAKAGNNVLRRGPARIQRIKRQARIQLLGQQQIFAHKTAKPFYALNAQTFDGLVQQTRTAAGGKDAERLGLVQEAEQWKSAILQIGRLTKDARQLRTGDAA
ncbi:dynamin family protein [Actinoplanes aureus]|uniref:Dynamin family protein n=1 Tax=Actinoplanes aureus TaxID=2792083 RepID=A0A931G2Y5_9ACTN|nr:dynamin family protein [Actinoplanes aureus]MBG0568665.1 dynamin family protein [Actinoplanes aureus]